MDVRREEVPLSTPSTPRPVQGTFLVGQAFTRALLEEPSTGSATKFRGAIVNVSSIDGKTGHAGYCQYSASKGGVTALTKTCAAELAK